MNKCPELQMRFSQLLLDGFSIRKKFCPQWNEQISCVSILSKKKLRTRWLKTDQGWKLLTVRLSGTGKNFGGQVNFFGTFLKESLKTSFARKTKTFGNRPK